MANGPMRGCLSNSGHRPGSGPCKYRSIAPRELPTTLRLPHRTLTTTPYERVYAFVQSLIASSLLSPAFLWVSRAKSRAR